MRASGNKSASKRVPCPVHAFIRGLCAIAFGLVSIPLVAGPAGEHRVHDLYYGQALYQYFKENELAAITALMVADTKPAQATAQVDEARLLLADLFYSYGLYQESRNIFAQLLNAEVSDAVQNRIWFNLARLRYDQGYYEHARDLLSRINDQLPKRIEAERKYLLTNLYLGNGQYEQAADLSNRIEPGSIWKSYARYNLGVALIEDAEYEQGEHILDRLGQLDPVSSESIALRDRANLSLGLKQLRMQAPEAALQSLLRVRLEGPLSNQALLASGWAWFRLEQYDKAQVPWRLLVQRNAVDAATQEAILAIPANYAESGQDRLAIRQYELAANQFDLQLVSLQEAIRSIEGGELIAALRENAILHDRSHLQRLPPSSDVTPLLQLLLASSVFHREIKRYQDLLDIRDSLLHWSSSFPSLKLMLNERRQAFTKKLPMLQETGSFDQLEQIGRRRDQYAARLDAIITNEEYAALAQAEERDNLQRLQSVAGSIDRINSQRNTDDQQDMLRLLSGLLDYQLATEYPTRLWKARKQLLQLDRALGEARDRASKLRRITSETEVDFKIFERRIGDPAQRIENLRLRVNGLLQQQEQHINRLAVDAIRSQQQHIVQLRLNARFELARIYDKLSAPQ